VIDQIRLTNFKCFESLNLDLAPLTLLTGVNAGGKSTATQTLLLLSQTLRGPRDLSCLLLNGTLATLGTPADVLNTNGGSKLLSLGARAHGEEATWYFEVPEEDRRILKVQLAELEDSREQLKLPGETLIGIRPQGALGSSAISRLENLIYLSAGRQVDTEVFPTRFSMAASAGDVGPIGQFAASWLHELGEDDARAERRHSDSTTAMTIRQQVNAWIGDLFPGAESNSLPVPQANLMLLQLRSGITSGWVRPANIGYGISYAFPIVVAGLCAAAGQTVILDSPEAHLHPRAQSRIGRFLTQMASAGVQMLVETHSDHVLNGVRIAIRDGLIAPEQTAIYFFSGRPEARVVRLSVDKHGTIHDLPEGFFDQAERDLGNLAGWN
jgi:energy-coupling factor transporter ATP-binding protein EcfA2